MKRLGEEAPPELEALSELLDNAERYEPNPFAKRALRLRLERAVTAPAPRLARWPAWLALGALLIAGSAAASYAVFADDPPVRPVAVSAPAPVLPAPSATPRTTPTPTPTPTPSDVPAPAPSAEVTSERLRERPRAGEDPSQVAEAVRALRKQGDPARAQALLDRYLRDNPRGALSEDALALAIEAAAARKDARAADYARRYLARYPNGRFRGLAERTLAR